MYTSDPKRRVNLDPKCFELLYTDLFKFVEIIFVIIISVRVRKIRVYIHRIFYIKMQCIFVTCLLQNVSFLNIIL